MQFWLEFFSIIAAIALVVQVVMLTLLFFQMRRTSENVNRLTTDLQSAVGNATLKSEIGAAAGSCARTFALARRHSAVKSQPRLAKP